MTPVQFLFAFVGIVRDFKRIKFIYDDLNYDASKRQKEPFERFDEVMKVTGDYHIKGIVLVSFYTLFGRLRYVVEHQAEGGGSFCHIYAHSNLMLVKRGK